MTRKRFNNLIRYWFLLMDDDLKRKGIKPHKKCRACFDNRVAKGCSYLTAWVLIRESTPVNVRRRLPFK